MNKFIVCIFSTVLLLCGCAEKNYLTSYDYQGEIVESGVNKKIEIVGKELQFRQKMTTGQQELEILFAEVAQGNPVQRRAALLKLGYKPCKICGETGSITCPVCGGASISCSRCNGTGNIETSCIYCGGRGIIGVSWNKFTNHGDLIFCSFCNGTGKIEAACPVCNGTGKMQCRSCGGTGKIHCGYCNGTGWEGMKQKMWK